MNAVVPRLPHGWNMFGESVCFRVASLYGNYTFICILFKISLKFVSGVQLIMNQHWFRYLLGTQLATNRYLNQRRLNWLMYASRASYCQLSENTTTALFRTFEHARLLAKWHFCAMSISLLDPPQIHSHFRLSLSDHWNKGPNRADDIFMCIFLKEKQCIW